MNHLVLAWTLICLIASAGLHNCWADVSLSSIFTDHMVLQRGKTAPVWGKAAAGEEVTVHFDDQTVSTTADQNGNWSANLAPLEASHEPESLTVKGNNKLTINDVLVGEVWLGSGQSNMEWALSASDNAKAD